MTRNVLVLGAGMMAPPLVRYLLAGTNHRVIVGALDIRRVEPVLGDFSRGRALVVDVADEAALLPLVLEADIVVSLLPASLNARIARMAIERRIPFVNTSYVSPELLSLDAEARKAGVLLLGEIGLDPGLDHMSAVRLIRRVRGWGGILTTVQSCCGGLPAPAANDNPWGYKFSWFPRAVLTAARQPARYLHAGEVVEVEGPDLFARAWPWYVEGLGLLETYPNRNSLAYRADYDLRTIQGLYRGTLRYPGWSATLQAVGRLGLLDIDEMDWPSGTTYSTLVTRRLPPGSGRVVERVAGFLGLREDDAVIGRLEWAGLLSDRLLPEGRISPLDVLAGRVSKLMTYRTGEQDMVVLDHRVMATFPDGHVEEVSESLVTMGEPFGDSAMSRTVALPAAVATRLVLAGAVEAVGVQIPVLPELWRPVLDELEGLGLGLRERRTHIYAGPLA